MKEAHARERLPHGQVLTQKWPVLTYGEMPSVDLETWTLPLLRSGRDAGLLNRWEGVAVSEILRRVGVRPEAVAVMVHGDPDYTTNLLLTDLLSDDALLVLKHDGKDLPAEHGGPCRLVVPELYFWKSATRPRRPTPCSESGRSPLAGGGVGERSRWEGTRLSPVALSSDVSQPDFSRSLP